MTFLTSMLRRSAKRRMMSELLLLDDHLLRDVGLNRIDLRAAMISGSAAALAAQHAHA